MALPDVVYLVKRNGRNEELRYSLRSLKNVPHGEVFIVGDLPNWVRNVTYIPASNTHTKYRNTLYNLMAACGDERISEDFIFMNDDIYIMKELSEVPVLHRGPIETVIRGYKDIGSTRYVDLMVDTKALLEKLKLGNNMLSYELHVPIVLNRQKLMTVLKIALLHGVMNKRTLYGNYWNIGGKQIEDPKISGSRRPLGTEAFLSSSDLSFRVFPVGKYIRSIFTDHCSYEKDGTYTTVPILTSEGDAKSMTLVAKIQNYNNGEIWKTNNGNYVLVSGETRSQEYHSIAMLVHQLGAETQQVPPEETEGAPQSPQEDDEPSNVGDTEETANPQSASDETFTIGEDVFTSKTASNGQVQYRKNGKRISSEEFEKAREDVDVVSAGQ